MLSSGCNRVVVLLLAMRCVAAGADDSFSQHLKLAGKKAEAYGFPSSAEMMQAKQGTAYPYFSIQEWKSVQSSAGYDQTAALHAAPRQLVEVVDQKNIPQCVFIKVRQDDGTYLGAVLGFPNLKDELLVLREITASGNSVVLLVDPETHQLCYVKMDRPGEIQTFTSDEE